MSFAQHDGTRVTKANFPTTPVTTEAMVEVTEDVFQAFTYHNAHFEGGSRLAYREGQVVRQAEIDALFADATIDTVTPATGPAAGGTDIVIKGGNFAGAAGVTIGGAAATLFKVLDEKTITCRTPAHAAGAVNVVLADDSGNITKTGAYTYT